MPIGCQDGIIIVHKSFSHQIFFFCQYTLALVAHLLNKLNASSQIHAKVNELPVNSLLLVLFLLEDKHVMVEELLQFFIGEVDTQLFQTVVLQRKR